MDNIYKNLRITQTFLHSSIIMSRQERTIVVSLAQISWQKEEQKKLSKTQNTESPSIGIIQPIQAHPAYLSIGKKKNKLERIFPHSI